MKVSHSVHRDPNTIYGGIMEKDKYQRFKDQVWTTRISRANAEKRLINKENFFQGINIYYSCITIIFSILSLYYHDDELSLMTVFMTISLLTVILYLNGQKYLEHAREYRKNYTAIHKLEFQLEHLDEESEDEIQAIENKYCELLDSSSNHTSYDYYCTVYGSNKIYKEKRWKSVWWKFYLNIVWRIGIKILVIVLPVLLFWFCEVI